MGRSRDITFGVRIPVEGWVPVAASLPDFSYLLRLADVAEEQGYDFLLAADHLMNWIGSSPGKPASRKYLALGTYESWTVLSALSTATKKIKLSNIVLCNLFRNPALLAKMGATLDLISGGRFVLSLGAGWMKTECRRLGLDWFPYGQRIRRLRESIRVIKMLWTQERSDFTGEYYRLDNAILAPKPITKPHPPIWLGGASDEMMHIVAEEADGWDVGLAGSPEAVRAKVEGLERFCDQVSKDPNHIVISHSCMAVMSSISQQSMELAKAKSKDLNVSFDSFVRRHLVGSPMEIASKMKEYVEAGVTHFTIYFDPDVSNLECFASEVIPRIT